MVLWPWLVVLATEKAAIKCWSCIASGIITNKTKQKRTIAMMIEAKFLQSKSLRFGLRKTKWNCYNNCLSFPWMQYHRRCCWMQKLFEYFNNKGKLKLDTCDSRVFILDWTCATDQMGKGKKAGAFTQLPFTTIWSINQETTRLEEWGRERRQAGRGSHEVDG